MAYSKRRLHAASYRYPLKKAFGISRGTKTSADVVIVTIEQGAYCGRGECVPYERYGETIASVIEQIDAATPLIESNTSRSDLTQEVSAGAARNAIDCALWDLEVKRDGVTVFDRLMLTRNPLTTAYTVPYSDVEEMRKVAFENARRPLLKIKLGSPDDIRRLEAVAAAAPNARLIVDANEGWSLQDFEKLVGKLVEANVMMVEQPLPVGDDTGLKADGYPFMLCADESCHDRKSLESVIGHYDMINIKLDKTGGLTEALSLKEEARAAGLKIMVGCMVGSSLAMAPAFVLGQGADIIDLDGPLLLKHDVKNGFEFDNSLMMPPSSELWG